jgi:hypothetical protein
MVQGGQRILNVGDGSGSPNPLRRKNDRGSVPSVSVLFYESSLQKPVTKLLEMFGVFVRLVIIGYHVMRSMPSNEVLASTVAADTKEASIRNATQSVGSAPRLPEDSRHGRSKVPTIGEISPPDQMIHRHRSR